MLGVERACMECTEKAVYLWKAGIRKVHENLIQQSGKECESKESKLRRAKNFD